MKYHAIYNDLLNCSDDDEVFQYLVQNLADTITIWSYFVDWGKVLGNVQGLEIDLNTMNYLIGKHQPEDALAELLRDQPRLIRLIPVLLAIREKALSVLLDSESNTLDSKTYDFTYTPDEPLTEDRIQDACEFAEKSGLLDMFRQEHIRSVPDYVLGVEVGLDSNGRKNRGGQLMEDIVEAYILPLCNDLGYDYMTQGTYNKVKKKWSIELPVDNSRRRYDVVIKTPSHLYIIETNFYSGGGSKLKSTAGEYQKFHDRITQHGHKFLWITDGYGWKKTTNPLRDTFDYIDHLLNLRMVSEGVLAQILIKGL